MAKKTSIEVYRESLLALRKPTEHRKPVHYFYGDEPFFIDALQSKALSLLSDDQKDFNLDILYGSETTPEKALSIIRSYPMMSEFRLVIIRDFSRMKGASAGGGHINDFIPYLEQPNPTTLLIITDTKSPDKRTGLGKLLNKSTNVNSCNFDRIDEHRLPDWIDEWIRTQYNKKIEPGAAHMLGQLVGSDLMVLSTELEKVCTFVDTSEIVTKQDVKKIIGSYREFSVFELKEAVLSRNLPLSLKISEQMLLKTNEDAGEVFKTVGFFYSVFSNIWQILRLAEKGLSKDSVQQEMGIKNSWYFNILWKEAAGFKLGEMPQIFEALLDADRAAKGFSTLDTSSILLLLIRRIVSQ